MAEDLYGINRKGWLQAIADDISPYDCLLDLIDNAIDTASSASDNREEYGSYKIQVNLVEKKLPTTDNSKKTTYDLYITDNIGGMSREKLHEAFVAYRENNEQKVIGRYGIGLQRALYKLGGAYRVTAWQEGKQCSTGEFDKTSMEEGSFQITPSVYKKTGNGTEVIIYGLNDDLKNKLKQQSDLAKDLRIRYAEFVEAGLEIKYNASRIVPIILKPVQKKKLIKKTDKYKYFEVIEESHDDLYEDWRIDIQVGALSAYDKEKVASEWDESRKSGGWYIFFNRRCILLADKSEKTGWGYAGATRFHAQYNGFLGIVNIYSGDTITLPFDTTKSNIRSDHKGYQKLIKKLVEYNRLWASFTGKAINQRKSIKKEALFPAEWGKPLGGFAARFHLAIAEGQKFEKWKEYPIASAALIRVTLELALRHAIRLLNKKPKLYAKRQPMYFLIDKYSRANTTTDDDKNMQQTFVPIAHEIRKKLNDYMHNEANQPTVPDITYIINKIDPFIHYVSHRKYD